MNHLEGLEQLDHLICLACLQPVNVNNTSAVICLTCSQLMCEECASLMDPLECAKCRQEVAYIYELAPGFKRILTTYPVNCRCGVNLPYGDTPGHEINCPLSDISLEDIQGVKESYIDNNPSVYKCNYCKKLQTITSVHNCPYNPIKYVTELEVLNTTDKRLNESVVNLRSRCQNPENINIATTIPIKAVKVGEEIYTFPDIGLVTDYIDCIRFYNKSLVMENGKGNAAFLNYQTGHPMIHEYLDSHNLRHGEYIWFQKDGTIEEIGYYLHGLEHGVYYKQGTSVSTYYKGRRHGVQLELRDSTTLREYTCVHNCKVGEDCEYWSSGRIRSIKFYEIGEFERSREEGLEIRYSENGEIEFTCTYADNLKHGTETTYYTNTPSTEDHKSDSVTRSNVHIERSTEYEMGVKHGLDELFAFNGDLLYKANYKKGILDGACEYTTHFNNPPSVVYGSPVSNEFVSECDCIGGSNILFNNGTKISETWILDNGKVFIINWQLINNTKRLLSANDISGSLITRLKYQTKEIPIVDGFKHGIVIKREGNYVIYTEYVNGRKHGTQRECITWHPEDICIKRDEYAEGKRHGFSYEYIIENGAPVLKNKELYRKGSLISRKEYNGLCTISTQYQDGLRHGEMCIWINSELRAIVEYRQGKLHNVARMWGADGDLVFYALFEDGVMQCVKEMFKNMVVNRQDIETGTMIIYRDPGVNEDCVLIEIDEVLYLAKNNRLYSLSAEMNDGTDSLLRFEDLIFLLEPLPRDPFGY